MLSGEGFNFVAFSGLTGKISVVCVRKKAKLGYNLVCAMGEN